MREKLPYLSGIRIAEKYLNEKFNGQFLLNDKRGVHVIVNKNELKFAAPGVIVFKTWSFNLFNLISMKFSNL